MGNFLWWIEPVGGSTILQLSDVMVGGIILAVIPLLSLTANQIAKLKTALQHEGMVRCYHLDETNPKSVKEMLIPRLDPRSFCVRRSTSPIMYIFGVVC